MNKSHRIFVVVVLVGLIGYLIWLGVRPPTVDSTGKFHTHLYEGASETFDAQISILPFQPQEIDSETVGSSTYLRAEWSQPEKKYNHFLITISDPASDFTRTEAGEHDRVSLDLSDLTPDTEYTIALQACLEPTCERWFISQQEYTGRTAIEYLDEEETLLNP